VPVIGDYVGSLAVANCLPKVPAKLYASNVAGGEAEACRTLSLLTTQGDPESSDGLI
jgi:hypothetical protein